MSDRSDNLVPRLVHPDAHTVVAILPQEFKDLPVADIVADTNQPRQTFDDEGIAKLAATFAKHGFIQPLRVRPLTNGSGKWGLIGGERRLRAAKMAQLTTIPCLIIYGDLSDADVFEAQIVDNEHREDLNPIDKSKAYKKMMEMRGWSPEVFCATLHLNLGTVKKLLMLLNLIDSVQEMVKTGSLTQAAGGEVAKLPATMQQKVAELIVYEGLTAAAAAALVRRQSGQKRQSSGGTREFYAVEKGTRVAVTSNKKLGQEGVVAALGQALKEAMDDLMSSQGEPSEPVSASALIDLIQAFEGGGDALGFSVAAVARRIAPLIVAQFQQLSEHSDPAVRTQAAMAINNLKQPTRQALAAFLLSKKKGKKGDKS